MIRTVAGVAELRTHLAGWRERGQRIALVPTMGNLHPGHHSLIELARRNADRVVASVFVNPTQFGPDEDFARYPRTPEADAEGLARAGCDLLFLPGVEAMYPLGVEAAVRAVKASGLRVTGFQVLRDFEGLSGHLHDYKVEVAKSMLELCATLESRLLLVCSSTSVHASHDLDHLAADLRKLSMLALPLGIKIAYEALSWGRVVNQFTTAWDVVCRADAPNLGLGIDSFHIFAAGTPIEEIDYIDPEKILLVQLSDFMWQETKTFAERIATARTFRVFPGEGVHSQQLVDLVLRLNALRYILHRLPYANKDHDRIGPLDPLIVGRANVVYEQGEDLGTPIL